MSGLIAGDHPDADCFGQMDRLISLPAGSTVSVLIEALKRESSKYNLDNYLVVLNHEVINGDRPLSDGDVVALFAPVLGG
jgi:molybdopterin converting factor small subunit